MQKRSNSPSDDAELTQAKRPKLSNEDAESGTPDLDDAGHPSLVLNDEEGSGGLQGGDHHNQAETGDNDKSDDNGKFDDNDKSDDNGLDDGDDDDHKSETESQNVNAQKLQIEYRKGDMFEGAEDSQGLILVHSCNCIGKWGAGVALEFARHFEAAYLAYKDHCAYYYPTEILGSALILTPENFAGYRKEPDLNLDPTVQPLEKRNFVACLFTRDRPGGRSCAIIDETVKNTTSAMKDLVDRIHGGLALGTLKDVVEIRMPKINAGLFGVPWDRTEEMLLNLEVPPGQPLLAKVVVYEFGDQQPDEADIEDNSNEVVEETETTEQTDEAEEANHVDAAEKTEDAAEAEEATKSNE